MDLFVASDYQLHRPLGNRAVQKKTNISDLSMSEAEAELTALSLALNRANHDYHSADTPSISDAEYDRLKPHRSGRGRPGGRVCQTATQAAHAVIGQCVYE